MEELEDENDDNVEIDVQNPKRRRKDTKKKHNGKAERKSQTKRQEDELTDDEVIYKYTFI